jgi:molybdate transport system permease protein
LGEGSTLLNHEANVDLSLILLTLKIATVATAINLPLALAVSWLVTKKRVRGATIIDALVSLPLAVPPVVVGFFLLLALGRDGPIGKITESLFGTQIVFTWFAAVLASAVVSFPLIARSMMTAMSEVDERLEMSARSLGAGPWRTIFTITIPLAYRGILAGVLLGFVRALSEFGATITVAGNIPGRTQTLALAIYSNVQIRDDATAIKLVAVSIGLALATLLVHNWLLSRTNRKGRYRR